jgi:hypothetical protein
VDRVGACDLRRRSAHRAPQRLAIRGRRCGRVRRGTCPRRADGRHRGSVDGLLPVVSGRIGAGACSVAG